MPEQLRTASMSITSCTKYRPRSQRKGSTIEKGYYVDKRDRRTRAIRWEQANDNIVYSSNQLDRDVVAQDQIRTVIRTFKDVVRTEIFPGRRRRSQNADLRQRR